MTNATSTKIKFSLFALFAVTVLVHGLINFSKYDDVTATLSFFTFSLIITIISSLIFLVKKPTTDFDLDTSIAFMTVLPFFNIFSIAMLLGWNLDKINKRIFG